MQDAQAFIAKIHHIKFKVEDVAKFAELVENPNPLIKLIGLVAFRRLLSIPHQPPIQQVIDTGKVPLFISLLGMVDYPKI